MAELKNQRTIAPEAHSMHLTPDTDPASTFRLRNLGNRPRLDQLQFGTTSPPASTQVRLSAHAPACSLLLMCPLCLVLPSHQAHKHGHAFKAQNGLGSCVSRNSRTFPMTSTTFKSSKAPLTSCHAVFHRCPPHEGIN